MPPELSLCAFEDGELATTYAAYPFTMRLNGAPARAAGVTFVGTLPWFRRRGHLRAITEHDFRRRYEQRMEPIAILTASISGIYHRYGYAVTAFRDRYSIDPRWVNFVPSLPKAEGTWREAHDDPQPLKDVYRTFATGRERLHPPRAGDVVDAGARARPGLRRPNWARHPCRVRGRTASRRDTSRGRSKWAHGPIRRRMLEVRGQRIYVRDYVYKTSSAYRAMWEYLKNF